MASGSHSPTSSPMKGYASNGGPGTGTMSTLGSSGPESGVGGFAEFFLTQSQKYNFSKWKTLPNDRSITTKLLEPLWQFLARKLPVNVAPNVLNLIGMLLVIQAWHMSRVYSALYPSLVTLAVVVQLSAFYVLHSVAPIHGRLRHQHTPVTELFGYTTDCISTIFLVLIVWTLLDVDLAPSVETQWHAVMAAQLVMFSKHLSAQKREGGLEYSLFAGPGEIMTLVLIILLVRATVGVNYGPRYMLDAWTGLLGYLSVFFTDYLPSVLVLPEMADIVQTGDFRDPVKVGALLHPYSILHCVGNRRRPDRAPGKGVKEHEATRALQLDPLLARTLRYPPLHPRSTLFPAALR